MTEEQLFEWHSIYLKAKHFDNQAQIEFLSRENQQIVQELAKRQQEEAQQPKPEEESVEDDTDWKAEALKLHVIEDACEAQQPKPEEEPKKKK